MEQLTIFVSSRGILKSCAFHNAAPRSSLPLLDADLTTGVGPGQTVYVCTDALEKFATSVFPAITNPIVLVSGDSDKPVDAFLLQQGSIAAMLASERLITWFAQNLAASHHKLAHLPIGMDYHTMWAQPGMWGLSRISPVAQEHRLQSILADSPLFHQRYLTAYCNWHFALHRGDRQECMDNIDKTACFFEAHPIPRLSTWQRQSECMFVISPHGAGLDCHRTWEALLLGCVPVIKHSSLDPLFVQLPVFVVTDWKDVTRDALAQFAKRMLEQKYNFYTLFKEYWLQRLAGKVPQLIDDMSFEEFRQWLTRQTA